jgi:hypothetical protein
LLIYLMTGMNSPNTDLTIITAEKQAIIDGLNTVRSNGLQGMLTAISGPPGARRKHVRYQAAVTPLEAAALLLAKHTLGLHLGRPVSHSLVLRLALTELCVACDRSLRDPAEAARLRARLIATREERVSELASIPTDQ